MCGSCARMVVAPRPRVPVPVQGSRPPVAVPVARPDQRPAPKPVAMPVPVAAQAQTAPMPTMPDAQAATAPISPWVRNRTDAGEFDGAIDIELGSTHDGGLLQRGIHAEFEQD